MGRKQQYCPATPQPGYGVLFHGTFITEAMFTDGLPVGAFTLHCYPLGVKAQDGRVKNRATHLLATRGKHYLHLAALFDTYPQLRADHHRGGEMAVFQMKLAFGS
jgi:hypothetical protein